jgi:hypothetical protein
MKLTLAQRFDTYLYHMEQRETWLTPEENKQFLEKVIEDCKGRLFMMKCIEQAKPPEAKP